MVELLETSYFIPVIILLAITALTSLLSRVFKFKFLPVFVIEIIIGLLIGRFFNKFIIELNLEKFVDGLYVLSLSLIIFFSGYLMETDINKNFPVGEVNNKPKKEINIFKVSLLLTLFSYIAALIMAFIFSSYIDGSYLVGIILLTIVFSSTFAALIDPVLVENNMLSTVLGETIATVADFSEVLSIVFLSIIMIVMKDSNSYIALIVLIGLFIVISEIFKRLRPGRFFAKFKELMDHLAIKVVIVGLLLFVLLSNLAGAEFILGAFFMGMFVKKARFSEGVVSTIRTIVYGIFAPLFFLLVGMRVDIYSVFNSWNGVLTVFLLSVAFIAVELPVLYLLRYYTKKAVIPTMFLLTSTIIVPIAVDHINHDLNVFKAGFTEALIVAGIIVVIIGTILFQNLFPKDKFINDEEVVHE